MVSTRGVLDCQNAVYLQHGHNLGNNYSTGRNWTSSSSYSYSYNHVDERDCLICTTELLFVQGLGLWVLGFGLY